MSADLIEAMARAMALAQGWQGWDTATHFSETPSGNEPEEEREHHRDMAKAALAAIAARPLVSPPKPAFYVVKSEAARLMKCTGVVPVVSFRNNPGPGGVPFYTAPPHPGIDLARLEALVNLWDSKRSYTGSPENDLRSIINVERGVARG